MCSCHAYDETAAREAILASTNWSEALRRLGLRAAGGNHSVLKRWVDTWGISTEHFAPYANAARHLHRPLKPLESVLVEGSTYQRASLKRRLYDAGLKQRACEMCGQGEIWRGCRMSLILDHINGVHDDNRLENLRIVCANCAATLPTHCSRNHPPAVCPTCGREFRKRHRQQYCSQRCWQDSIACRAIRARGQQQRVPRPTYEQLLTDLEAMNYVAVGHKYGVSDTAIRKWLRRYERGATQRASASADAA